MGGDQGGVEVEDELIGPGPGGPGRRAGRCPGGADPIEQLLVDRVDHPVGGRIGGDAAEQLGLAAQHAQIRQTIAAVGDRHDQVADNNARIVG